MFKYELKRVSDDTTTHIRELDSDVENPWQEEMASGALKGWNLLPDNYIIVKTDLSDALSSEAQAKADRLAKIEDLENCSTVAALRAAVIAMAQELKLRD